MKTILLALILTLSTTSVMAIENQRQRPFGLKAQVSEMRAETPNYFSCMLTKANTKWGTDQNMVLYTVKSQVSAYWDFREGDYPEQIILDAFEKWGCNFVMIMHMIKTQVNAQDTLGDLLN